jgi:hypothetical protein
MLKFILIFVFLFPAASQVNANMIWPELLLAGEIWTHSLMLIVLSLLVEWPFVKKATHTTWFYSFNLTCLANLVSMTIGMVGLVFFGILVSWLLDGFLGGTFSLGRQYIAGFSLAGMNTVFELGSLVFLSQFKPLNSFCSRVYFSKKNVRLFFMANFCSAILTVVYLSLDLGAVLKLPMFHFGTRLISNKPSIIYNNSSDSSSDISVSSSSVKSSSSTKSWEKS